MTTLWPGVHPPENWRGDALNPHPLSLFRLSALTLTLKGPLASSFTDGSQYAASGSSHIRRAAHHGRERSPFQQVFRPGATGTTGRAESNWLRFYPRPSRLFFQAVCSAPASAITHNSSDSSAVFSNLPSVLQNLERSRIADHRTVPFPAQDAPLPAPRGHRPPEQPWT